MARTTKTKRAEPQPELHTIRDQEVAVELAEDDGERPTFAIYSRPFPLTTYAWVFYPGRVYIVPRYALVGGDDVERFVRDGTFVVREDVTEAEIPQAIDYANSIVRATVRDGRPPGPTEGELRNNLRQKYASWSLGDTIFECVRAGWDEDKAAAILCREYESAFSENRGSQESWRELGTEMIAAERARQAGVA